jgi:ribosomal protein S18 acetylase RimI-like enzyme
MDITIGPARPEELEAVGELTAAAYLDDGLRPSEEYLRKLRDARHRADHAELLAATAADGTLLGSVTFAPPGSPYRELAGPDEGEFRMLAVASSARRRGVAEALVRTCLDRARGLGMRRVVISSNRNMAAAHRLYARLGFVRAPERDWEPIPGVWLWALTVEL